MFFDTHAHLDQDDFDADREAVVRRAHEAGLVGIVAVGTTVPTSRKCVALAEQFEMTYAAVGIQPNYVAAAEAGDWDQIEELAKEGAGSRASGPSKIVALGETGLDRYWDHSPFELQQDYFDRHLRLSQRIGTPFIVHMRDCEEDILVMLREARRRGELSGVMHSFTGDAKMASECIELGLMISFAGMVTYKKSDALRECAATIPGDRLLIETDSPYLSPVPVRKVRRNEPAHLVHTVACLAEARGCTTAALAKQTTENARRFFSV